MAKFITPLKRLTAGERRFAMRLEEKLEDDYYLWSQIPVGDRPQLHPDFVVLHPSRGLLVLEVKDWKLETIRDANPQEFTLVTADGPRFTTNPIVQAQEYTYRLKDTLTSVSALLTDDGKLCMTYGYGAVLTNITRKQFVENGLGAVMKDHLVICKDEMLEDVDPLEFQTRLWGMFPWPMRTTLTLPQIDRVREKLFPEIRVGSQMNLFAEPSGSENVVGDAAVEAIVKVMDREQERLARNLGQGHRVIHGVAGSGKTMLLVYRCVELARATSKPILVLCYNKALAAYLSSVMHARGLSERVTVRNFHGWCRDQLVAYHVPLPRGGEGQSDAYARELVERVVRGVDAGHIPSEQYAAVLIDEGHDFEPLWLKLAVQMVDTETNSFLLLYDDAQSIYRTRERPDFSFRGVGIQAQGRTKILKVNYRNTSEVLNFAWTFARDMLAPRGSDDDGIPLVAPEASKRHGPPPSVVCLASLDHEADRIAKHYLELHARGLAWCEMAVLHRANFVGNRVAERLAAAGVPVTMLSGSARGRKFDLAEDAVRFVSFHSSKGLEFHTVAIPGIDFAVRDGTELRNEVQLLYVAMTRATDRLLLSYHRDSAIAERLEAVRDMLAA